MTNKMNEKTKKPKVDDQDEIINLFSYKLLSSSCCRCCSYDQPIRPDLLTFSAVLYIPYEYQNSTMASPKKPTILTKFTKLDSILVLIVGILIGSTVTSLHQKSTTTTTSTTTTNTSPQNLPKEGSITHLDDIPIRKTSHVDEEGRPITKQQFLDAFVLPDFVGFSVATFLPGQVMMPPHEHETLYEIFYVVEG